MRCIEVYGAVWGCNELGVTEIEGVGGVLVSHMFTRVETASTLHQ